MHALQRTAAILIFPAIAWLATACNQAEEPTGPQLAGPAMALSGSNTLWVNDDGVATPTGTSCNNPNYNRIQDAVTAASPGYRINVCPGVYPEQVIIGTGKDGITLRSTKQWDAVIQAPAVMLDDGDGSGFTIVRVSGAQNVTILSFTITGPRPVPGCGLLHFGVRVHNSGSANILGNHITQIRDEPMCGSQNGRAVQIGRITAGSAQILGNVIDNYQKNGVDVRHAGSSAEIAHNRIFGVGPTATIAQNGIVVLGDAALGSATATIRHNFVANNIYTPPGTEAAGILPFQSGQVVTDHNTVALNEVDIYMFEAATGSTTTHNHVRASYAHGVVVDGSNGVRVDNNKVEDNEGSGILLDNAQTNTVSDNQVKENGSGSSDLTDGIRVEITSTGNTIENNHLKENVTHDCHDNSVGGGTAGTANSWIDNHGETENKPGLCTKDPTDDAAFETSTTYGWDPSYPWYDGFGVASEYDWAATYATVDTESLLQLLPGIPVGGIDRALVSPQP